MIRPAADSLPTMDAVESGAGPMQLPPELAYFHDSDAWRVDLEDFHGPLDLLLYLIQKDEIDIYDIPIAGITEQFLKYLEVIQMLSLDNAGDFIVMAATLMRIKTRLLLPVQAAEDEIDEDDPRAELVRRLLEYKRFKEAAESFRKFEQERTLYHLRETRYPFLQENNDPPELRLGIYDMLSALAGIFDRLTSEPVHSVEREFFTVEQKTALIQERLAAGGAVRFDELFAEDAIRMEVVVTFIAILELTRRGSIRPTQTEVNGPIWVQLAATEPAAAVVAAGGGDPA